MISYLEQKVCLILDIYVYPEEQWRGCFLTYQGHINGGSSGGWPLFGQDIKLRITTIRQVGCKFHNLVVLSCFLDAITHSVVSYHPSLINIVGAAPASSVGTLVLRIKN